MFVENLKQPGDKAMKYRPVGVITFATDTFEEMADIIKKVNETVHCCNENGEDMIIKYTDFDYLKRIYDEGLKENA